MLGALVLLAFALFSGALADDWKWFNQTLDHFGRAKEETFAQRYWHRSFAKKGADPEVVFLWVGGPTQVDEIGAHIEDGFLVWVEYAKEFQAECFLLEHRYYGKSAPAGSSSEDFRYFNSDQALADIVSFIKAQRPGAKWVTFGFNYGGSLAAWARQKYPEVVHAAVASSAPLLAAQPIPHFYDIFDQVKGICHDDGRASFSMDFSDLYQYQLCHEFGWLAMEMDGIPVSVGTIAAVFCDGDLDTMLKGIARTNAAHHGLNFTTERVHFIHGTLDPYTYVEKSVQDSRRVPVSIVRGCCQAMDALIVRSSDTSFVAKEIRKAQDLTRQYLKEWLNEPKTSLPMATIH